MKILVKKGVEFVYLLETLFISFSVPEFYIFGYM